MGSGLERAIEGVKPPRGEPNYNIAFYTGITIAGTVALAIGTCLAIKFYRKYIKKKKGRDSVRHFWKDDSYSGNTRVSSPFSRGIHKISCMFYTHPSMSLF